MCYVVLKSKQVILTTFITSLHMYVLKLQNIENLHIREKGP